MAETPKPEGDEVLVVSPNGKAGAIKREHLDQALASGYRIEEPKETEQRAIDKENSGFGAGIVAGLESAADTVTLGASRWVERELLGVDPRAMESRDRQHPVMSGIGAAATVLNPVGAVKMATKAGATAAKKLVPGAAKEGASLGTKAIGAGVATGTEGVILGAGAGVGQLAMVDEPITGELAWNVIGGNAVLGGVLGGGIGGGAKLLGEAAKAGRKWASEKAAKAAAKADEVTPGAIPDDLATMDRAGLKAAKEAENAKLTEVRTAEKKAVADDLIKYGERGKDDNYWLATEDKFIKKDGVKADRGMMSLAEDPKGLAMNPGQAAKTLRKQENVLVKVVDQESTLTKLRHAEMEAAEQLPTVAAGETATITGHHARSWAAMKKIRNRESYDLKPEQVEALRNHIKSGALSEERKLAMEAAKKRLAENRALQERLAQLDIDPTSPRMTAIDDAFNTYGDRMRQNSGGIFGTAIEGGVTSTLGTFAAGLGAPGALAYGVASKVGEAVSSVLTGKLGQLLGRVAKGTESSRASIGKSLDAFMDGKFKSAPANVVALKSARYSTPGASSVAAAYERPKTQPRTAMVAAFQERERELRAATMRGATGAAEVKPQALKAIAQNVGPIRLTSPKLADHLEAHAARVLAFMGSKLPQRPEHQGLPIGLDKWQPSDAELHKFSRYADAVEGGPEHIVSKMQAGKLTPEDAEVLREVYPESYAEIRNGLLERLAVIREDVPYEKRLMLGILFDVPTDASLDPKMLAAYQQRFQAEPGTNGGTGSPMPKPSGSVKFQGAGHTEPTQAQKLSQ